MVRSSQQASKTSSKTGKAIHGAISSSARAMEAWTSLNTGDSCTQAIRRAGGDIERTSRAQKEREVGLARQGLNLEDPTARQEYRFEPALLSDKQSEAIAVSRKGFHGSAPSNRSRRISHALRAAHLSIYTASLDQIHATRLYLDTSSHALAISAPTRLNSISSSLIALTSFFSEPGKYALSTSQTFSSSGSSPSRR